MAQGVALLEAICSAQKELESILQKCDDQQCEQQAARQKIQRMQRQRQQLEVDHNAAAELLQLLQLCFQEVASQ